MSMNWQEAMRKTLPERLPKRPGRPPKIPARDRPRIAQRAIREQLSDIADEYGVSEAYIRTIIFREGISLKEERRKLGLPLRVGKSGPDPLVPAEDRPIVAQRVLKGETYQSIADDYDVTRERIRQIATEEGVSSVRYTKYDNQILEIAEEVIYRRQQYRPAVAILDEMDILFNVNYFTRSLKRLDRSLYTQWMFAQKLPLSFTGKATVDGQVCARCHEYCVFDEFYQDKGPRTGKSTSCKDCAKRIVKMYWDNRNVPEPAVAERRCPSCKETKPADDFHRSTHLNSGLQTYCKPCQAEQSRASKKKHRST